VVIRPSSRQRQHLPNETEEGCARVTKANMHVRPARTERFMSTSTVGPHERTHPISLSYCTGSTGPTPPASPPRGEAPSRGRDVLSSGMISDALVEQFSVAATAAQCYRCYLRCSTLSNLLLTTKLSKSRWTSSPSVQWRTCCAGL
jgi:hypothetical protein